MNYFYSGDEQNNLIAECSLILVLIKNSLPVFFASKDLVSKKQAYYFGAFLSGWDIKHEPRISLNVGKQEISFPISAFIDSKNHLRKLILAFQHY